MTRIRYSIVTSRRRTQPTPIGQVPPPTTTPQPPHPSSPIGFPSTAPTPRHRNPERRLTWLEYRRATWPDTASRHVLVSRISALGTRPVSPDYLERHQPHGISLERIRRDRILQEALATGADPLHLALVFNIDHTNAMAYAHAARNLLGSPAEQE